MDLAALRAVMDGTPRYGRPSWPATGPERVVVRHRDDGSDSLAPLGVRRRALPPQDQCGPDLHGVDVARHRATRIDVWDYADSQGPPVARPQPTNPVEPKIRSPARAADAPTAGRRAPPAAHRRVDGARALGPAVRGSRPPSRRAASPTTTARTAGRDALAGRGGRVDRVARLRSSRGGSKRRRSAVAHRVGGGGDAAPHSSGAASIDGRSRGGAAHQLAPRDELGRCRRACRGSTSASAGRPGSGRRSRRGESQTSSDRVAGRTTTGRSSSCARRRRRRCPGTDHALLRLAPRATSGSKAGT